MPKSRKIKRYGRIYRRNRSSRLTLFRGIALVLGVVLLVFIGFSIYQPVYDFIVGRGEEPQPEPPPSSAPEAGPSSEPSSSDPEPEPEPATDPDLKAVFLPADQMLDPAAFSAFLDSLSGTGINAVILPLKDHSGNVLFQTDGTIATQVGAVTDNAVDLAGICSQLEDAGLQAVGMLQGFRDPIAASALLDAAVKYNNTEVLWLDNSPQLGGMPQLNPYSSQAQDYLYELAEDAVDQGVGMILIASIDFPTVVGSEYATYGADAASKTRQQVLNEFLTGLDQRMEAKGARAALYLSTSDCLTTVDARFGGSPLQLGMEQVMVDFSPAQFGTGISTERLQLENPVLTPGQTVSELIAQVQQDLPEGTGLIACLQAYTDISIPAESNRTYTRAEVEEQIQSAGQSGITEYALYSPDGVYPLQ